MAGLHTFDPQNDMPVLNRSFSYILCVIMCCIQCKQESSSEQVNKRNASDQEVIELIQNPVQPNGTVDSSKLARLLFLENTFDFGSIAEGQKIEHDYTFMNTGKIPVLISNVETSCGCTVSEWPKQPIKSGGSANIKVRFDSKDRSGFQQKTITVHANTYPSIHKLMLTGNIQTKK